jgi:hypothetical protein
MGTTRLSTKGQIVLPLSIRTEEFRLVELSLTLHSPLREPDPRRQHPRQFEPPCNKQSLL